MPPTGWPASWERPGSGRPPSTATVHSTSEPEPSPPSSADRPTPSWPPTSSHGASMSMTSPVSCISTHRVTRRVTCTGQVAPAGPETRARSSAWCRSSSRARCGRCSRRSDSLPSSLRPSRRRRRRRRFLAHRRLLPKKNERGAPPKNPERAARHEATASRLNGTVKFFDASARLRLSRCAGWQRRLRASLQASRTRTGTTFPPKG